MLNKIKLSYIVALIVICLCFAVLCLGYVKGREKEIRANHAVAHSIYERPIYFGGGNR